MRRQCAVHRLGGHMRITQIPRGEGESGHIQIAVQRVHRYLFSTNLENSIGSYLSCPGQAGLHLMSGGDLIERQGLRRYKLKVNLSAGTGFVRFRRFRPADTAAVSTCGPALRYWARPVIESQRAHRRSALWKG